MQAEALVPPAEQRLKDFETAMGLTRRVKASGQGKTARAEKDDAAKPAPKKKPASRSAAASASSGVCTSPRMVTLPQLYRTLHGARPS